MGSVDWNKRKRAFLLRIYRHSLYGECGLKWLIITFSGSSPSVTPCMGSVDWNWFSESHAVGYASHSLYGECGLKFAKTSYAFGSLGSLPVWGVWIEIIKVEAVAGLFLVTPCMGSVDWNLQSVLGSSVVSCHSLYGECGLKFQIPLTLKHHLLSLPVWGVWIEITKTIKTIKQS